MAKLLLAFIAVFLLSVTAFASPAHRVSDLEVIPLQDGPNLIDNFGPKAQQGLIVRGWRENGNAHGYFLYLTMLSKAPPEKGWDIVDTADDKDTVQDAPHTGEDYIRSVRFARGRVDGFPATLLITADKDWARAGNMIGPAPVSVSILRLVSSPEPFGTPYIFERISRKILKKKYCNSDLALNQALGLPLPDPYEGPNWNDGCP